MGRRSRKWLTAPGPPRGTTSRAKEPISAPGTPKMLIKSLQSLRDSGASGDLRICKEPQGSAAKRRRARLQRTTTRKDRSPEPQRSPAGRPPGRRPHRPAACRPGGLLPLRRRALLAAGLRHRRKGPVERHLCHRPVAPLTPRVGAAVHGRRTDPCQVCVEALGQRPARKRRTVGEAVRAVTEGRRGRQPCP
jgi:hypothetical protein